MSLFDVLKSSVRNAFRSETHTQLGRGRRLIERRQGKSSFGFGQVAYLVSMLTDQLRPQGRLDYQRAQIAMGVGTPMDFYRLTSCAKEPETVAWLESQLRPGDVFFDVGANVGAYSLVAAAIGGHDVRVFSFEPSFATFAQLSRNVFLNHVTEQITPVCLALSAETGVATFRFSDLSSGSAWHSLEPARVVPDDSSLAVMTVRMDDLVERFGIPVPNVLKIDVDDGEAAVLGGATRVLQRPELRSILIELNDDSAETSSMIERLVAYGFVATAKHRRSGSEYYNYIFVRAGGA